MLSLIGNRLSPGSEHSPPIPEGCSLRVQTYPTRKKASMDLSAPITWGYTGYV
jgi:hypothetical protein